jgi:hypothetical protein
MAVTWKSVPSGLAWIVFSPFMFVMGAAADRTSSDLEYEIQIGLFGAWSVLGVISGIGVIAGAAWAPHLQRVLRWILYVLLVVSAIAAVAVVITFILHFAG